MAEPKVSGKVYVGIVFDFETGSLECQTGACTQLCMKALRLDTLEIIDSMTHYIYPYNKKADLGKKKKVLKTKQELESESTGEMMDYEEKALTYSDISIDKLYKSGIPIEEMASKVIQFAKDNTITPGPQSKPVLIGQNVQFDVGFLQQMMVYGNQVKEFEKVFAGQFDFYGNFQPHYIDTIDLSKFALANDPDVNSFKLELAAEKLGIELDDAHDADADVTATSNIVVVCANKMRNGSGESAGLHKVEKTRKHFLL